MKQYYQKWQSFWFKNTEKILNEEEWDLENDILSEGTKVQAPLWLDKHHNDLKIIPFIARSNFHRKIQTDKTKKERSELSQIKSSSNKIGGYEKNSMLKIALSNSTKLVKGSNTEKESESPTTLKSEISQLLKMLANKRLRENRKQYSFSNNNTKWKKRQTSDVNLFEQASIRLEGIPQSILRQTSKFKDVTMSNVQPSIQIDSFL